MSRVESPDNRQKSKHRLILFGGLVVAPALAGAAVWGSFAAVSKLSPRDDQNYHLIRHGRNLLEIEPTGLRPGQKMITNALDEISKDCEVISGPNQVQGVITVAVKDPNCFKSLKIDSGD